VISPPSLGGDFGSSPVEYVLEAEDYDELNQAVGIMMEAPRNLVPHHLDTDLRLNKPQLDITVDRERAPVSVFLFRCRNDAGDIAGRSHGHEL